MIAEHPLVRGVMALAIGTAAAGCIYLPEFVKEGSADAAAPSPVWFVVLTLTITFIANIVANILSSWLESRCSWRDRSVTAFWKNHDLLERFAKAVEMALRLETQSQRPSPLGPAARIWIDAHVGTLLPAVESAVRLHDPANPASLFHGLHKDQFVRMLFPHTHRLVGLRVEGYRVLVATWVSTAGGSLSVGQVNYLATVLDRKVAQSFHEALKDDFVNEGYAWAALDAAFKKTVLESFGRIEQSIVRLEQSQADLHTDVRVLGEVAIKAGDDVSKLVKKAFPDPPLECRVVTVDASTSQFAGIEYRTRASKYLGRSNDEDRLKPFLDPAGGLFQWLVLLGEGGVGKSRFGLELCLGRAAEWNGGFLEIDAINPYPHWAEWQPQRPTFIVIDYAARNPAYIHSLLVTLAGRAADGTLAHPVRVLLIERDTEKDWPTTDWGEKVVGGGSRSSLVRTHYCRPTVASGTASPMEPFRLNHLTNDDLWAIITQVFNDQNIPEHLHSKADVLKRLSDVDASSRPLFALLTALFLADPDAQHTHDWSREHLLDYLIRKERTRHWAALGVTPFDQRLLALSCLCYGIIHSDEHDQIAQITDTPLFQGGQFDPARYRQMVGGSARVAKSDVSAVLPPLVPDIVGEYFLLVVIGELETQPRQCQFARLAWSLDPMLTAVVLDRLINDFPTRTETAALLRCIPNSSSKSSDIIACVRYAQVLVNRTALLSFDKIDELQDLLEKLRRFAAMHPSESILLDQFAKGLVNLTNRLGTLGLTDVGRMEQTLALLEELRLLQRSNPSEPALREQFAKGLVNLVNHLGALGQAEAGRMTQALEFLDELRQLQRLHPTEPALRERLANGLMNLTSDLGTVGRNDPARMMQTLAKLEELRLLSRNHPSEQVLRERFAAGVCNLIVHLVTMGLTDAGRVEQTLALLEELRQLQRSYPAEPALRERFAKGLYSLIVCLSATGLPDAGVMKQANQFIDECFALILQDRRLPIIQLATRACLAMAKALPDERSVPYLIRVGMLADDFPTHRLKLGEVCTEVGLTPESLEELVSIARAAKNMQLPPNDLE